MVTDGEFAAYVTALATSIRELNAEVGRHARRVGELQRVVLELQAMSRACLGARRRLERSMSSLRAETARMRELRARIYCSGPML